MEHHDIEIEIAKDGTVRAHIQGVKGAECVSYVEMLQKIVGKIQEQELTPEYYEPDSKVRIKPTLENRQEG
ncbi:MAG: DUF2997 domain-containing protein [Candidatus Sumerlaeota bacterium]|nr:DUF2997 domain-containing protein [Candidatus Sumerlaeota bacterium]